MSTTKKTGRLSGQNATFDDAFNFKALSATTKLEEARELVLVQTERLLQCETSSRNFMRQLSYNQLVLFVHVKFAENGATIIDRWLTDMGLTTSKATLLHKKVAKLVWGKHDSNGRRASDAAKVIAAAQRYFRPQTLKDVPTLDDYQSWVKACGGLDNIRKGKMKPELGGIEGPKTKTPQEVFEERFAAVASAGVYSRLPIIPAGAVAGELVVFYGLVSQNGDSTELRLACRPQEGDSEARSPHLLPSVRVQNAAGELLVPHGMGENVSLVTEDNTRTADKVIDQAATQAK